MKKLLFLVVVGLLCIGCSKDDDTSSDSIKNQNLTGIVQGKAFTFVGGKAFETTTFDDEPGLSLNLTNVSANCDDAVFDFELRISAIVPSQIGVYTNINIVDQDGNDVPFNNLDETVEITALSSTEISGKMKVSRSESSIAEETIFEGTFTLPICE